MTAESPNPMREALEEMLEMYGPPATVAALCEYPPQHPISLARAALSTKQEGECLSGRDAPSDEYRNAVLEEAARIAEGRFFLSDGVEQWRAGDLIAKAIRALKQEGLVAGADGKGDDNANG